MEKVREKKVEENIFPKVPCTDPSEQIKNESEEEKLELPEEKIDLQPKERNQNTVDEEKPNSPSISSCYTSEEEEEEREGGEYQEVSKSTEKSNKSEEQTDKEEYIEKYENKGEELTEEEEEEEDDQEPLNRTVTLVPVDYSTEREDIKICCVCNNIVSQHSESLDKRRRRGQCKDDKKEAFKNSYISGQNPYTEFPMCGCVAHFGCLIHSRWIRNNNSKKSVICPSCSEPKSKFTLQETRDYVKSMDQYKPVVTLAIPSDSEKKKILESLIQLLHQTGRHAEAIRYTVRMKKDFGDIWNFIKNEKVVKFDDFMKLGWDMSQVYHYVTSDFTELCNKYGFAIDHLSHEQTAVGLGINYKITARDLKTKFQREFNLKKLASLKMTPLSMMVLGINTHELCLLGMKKDGIKHFEKLSMRDWVKMLNFSKEHLYILGIRKEDFSNPKVLGSTYREKSKKVEQNSLPKKSEGVLWSVEGLRDLLQLTDDELIRYKLAVPEDFKEGGMLEKSSGIPSFSSKNHGYHHNARRRRKPLKERRRKNRSNRNNSPSGEYLFDDVRFATDSVISIPRNSYANRKTSKTNAKQHVKMPSFAPLSESEKLSMKELEGIRKDMDAKIL